MQRQRWSAKIRVQHLLCESVVREGELRLLRDQSVPES